jgi:hypothetical protein
MYIAVRDVSEWEPITWFSYGRGIGWVAKGHVIDLLISELDNSLKPCISCNGYCKMWRHRNSLSYDTTLTFDSPSDLDRGHRTEKYFALRIFSLLCCISFSQFPAKFPSNLSQIVYFNDLPNCLLECKYQRWCYFQKGNLQISISS